MICAVLTSPRLQWNTVFITSVPGFLFHCYELNCECYRFTVQRKTAKIKRAESLGSDPGQVAETPLCGRMQAITELVAENNKYRITDWLSS